MPYDDEHVQDYIVGHNRLTEDKLRKIAGKADEVFGS